MFRFKKTKKTKEIYTETYIVKDVDNIISIAQAYNIPWKRLAKINNIEPPYILIAGETINVPSNKGTSSNGEISNAKTFKHIKQQSNIENARIKSSDKIITDNIKSNEAVTQKQKIQEKKTTSNTNQKPRKIMYTSPKNMLHKPSAEPATQSIDIEWLQDDDEAYSEEIQLQKKKLNIRFIVISILIISIIGIGIWQGLLWFSRQNDNENVSVQALIEENENVKVDKNEKQISDNKDKKDDTNMAMEGGEDISKIENDQDKSQQNNSEQTKQQTKDDTSVAEITIQVLNAGAQIGAAGDVTKIFSKEGFKTISAQNAKNNYKGVVIYYNSDKKDKLETIAKKIPEKYGTQKHEESDEVIKKYKADFVIVLGS